ncbi:MAG: hypothetical protein IKT13_06000 [Paludibacteraceae bacterium]|nr:hypothetical protein [Paludibacteraceae bacterium]
MNSLSTKWSGSHLVAVCIQTLVWLAVLFPSCNPEAPWETKKVDLTMTINTVSAGFIECSFSTNKNAYYLIAIEPARKGEDPMTHQKQFMMLAMDSANLEYIAWRNELLKSGEMNVAPFASHALQYGSVTHFFTGLQPSTDYWVYAFVVNPDKMQSAGKLYLSTVTTTAYSVLDIHFDYRVKGHWDYVYPVDSLGNIYTQFPYIATTMDSAVMMKDDIDAIAEFLVWVDNQFEHPELADVLYGVKAVENDGWQSSVMFEEGHTYYTALAGFDGLFEHLTLYKFKWTGEDYNQFYHDTDSANIMHILLDLDDE